MDLSTVAVSGVLVVPLITAIIEMLKMVGLKDKYCPIASVLIGVLLGIFYIVPNEVMNGLLIGTALGLSACGFYDNINKLM